MRTAKLATITTIAALLWAGCSVSSKRASGGGDSDDGVGGSTGAGQVDDSSATVTSSASTGGPTGTTVTSGPTGGGAQPGACCVETAEPGCAADPAIEQCVCAEDSFCCESEWDALCISEVNEFGCGTCDVPDPPSSGSGGGTSEPVGCLDDGMCTLEDDCVCTDCDADMFCSDPANCVDDGMCDAFNEGCVCADCASHPECSN